MWFTVYFIKWIWTIFVYFLVEFALIKYYCATGKRISVSTCLCENDLEQNSQQYGFSPVWVLKCNLRFPGLANP